MNFTVKLVHFYLFPWLLSRVIGYSIETIPICGKIPPIVKEVLPPRDTQKIYFKDKDNGIRTMEINGTIIGCYPDATDEDFIDSTPTSSVLSFHPSNSKCTEHRGAFCTIDDNYPTEYVNYLVHRHWSMLAYVFGGDSFESKIDDHVEIYENLCDSHDEIIYPISGQTADDIEMYIFNTPEHKQGVIISECRDKGKSCKINEKYLNGTECQQKYINRELLALSHAGVPVKAQFKFPTHCMCAALM